MLVQAAALLIVWQTVLLFNRESLRAIRRILPSALALIMVLNVAAAGFGVVLANVAGLSQLDGYLATSPGGIYAVLGTAIGSDSNVAFIMAAQVIRVVLMLFAAPDRKGVPAVHASQRRGRRGSREQSARSRAAA